MLKFGILDFEIGDEVWWFKIKPTRNCMYDFSLRPGDIELVHDSVKGIENGYIYCWHSTKKPEDIWGKTRKQAWENLKRQIEEWGSLD